MEVATKSRQRNWREGCCPPFYEARQINALTAGELEMSVSFGIAAAAASSSSRTHLQDCLSEHNGGDSPWTRYWQMCLSSLLRRMDGVCNV